MSAFRLSAVCHLVLQDYWMDFNETQHNCVVGLFEFLKVIKVSLSHHPFVSNPLLLILPPNDFCTL